MAQKIDGKLVDDIRISGVRHTDYPDFVDAYVDTAFFADGTELSDDQRDRLTAQMQQSGAMFDRIMSR